MAAGEPPPPRGFQARSPGRRAVRRLRPRPGAYRVAGQRHRRYRRTRAGGGPSLTGQVAAKFVVSQRPSSIVRRAAAVEEVADLVVYVASPLPSAATGAALRVDGGLADTVA